MGRACFFDQGTQDFLSNEQVSRYGAARIVKVEGSSKFKDGLFDAVNNCETKLRIVKPYHCEAAGIIEWGHIPLKNVLVEMCGESWYLLKHNLCQPGYYWRKPASNPRLTKSMYTPEGAVDMLATQRYLK